MVMGILEARHGSKRLDAWRESQKNFKNSTAFQNGVAKAKAHIQNAGSHHVFWTVWRKDETGRPTKMGRVEGGDFDEAMTKAKAAYGEGRYGLVQTSEEYAG